MKYAIKNFRVFGAEGATTDIRPITILTGCNSSGKSSIVKSMILLNSFLENINDGDMDISKGFLDFMGSPNDMLGNYKSVLNNEATDNFITFCFENYSHLFGENITTTIVFAPDDNDDIGNGFLHAIKFTKADGTVIFNAEQGSCYEMNLPAVIPNFIRYINIQQLTHNLNYYDHLIQNFTQQDDVDFALKEVFSDDGFVPFYTILNDENFITDAIWCHAGLRDLDEIFKNDKSDIIEEIEDFLKSGRIFRFSLMEELDGATPKEVAKQLKEATKDSAHEKEYCEAIDVIVQDFKESGTETFGQYYITKEHEFLHVKKEECNDLNWTKRTKIPTPVFWCYWIADDVAQGFDIDNPDEKDRPLYKELRNKRDRAQQERHTTPNFDLLFSLLYSLQAEKTPTEAEYAYTKDAFKTLNLLRWYYDVALLITLKREYSYSTAYMGSSVVNIKKLYSLEENEGLALILQQFLNAKRDFLNKGGKRAEVGKFMNKWIRKFEVGHSVSVNVDAYGLGITIMLHKTEDDTRGDFLSNQGYGITQLVALLLRIETVILLRKNRPHAETFPLEPYFEKEVKMAMKEYDIFTIAIEEPEVHLHPRFQSMLADLFVEAYTEYGIRFIVETHSEYMIRKLQTLVARQKAQTDDIALAYVYDRKDYRHFNTPLVNNIAIKPDGILSDAFGKGFFDEANNLSLDLLTAKIENNEKA